MRTLVALVEARPETIAEDYQRVLDLAQLDTAVGDRAPRVMVASETTGFVPGWSAAPWQLDGTLAWLGERARQSPVLSVTAAGADSLPDTVLWQEVLTRHQARAADAGFLRPHRHVPRQLQPALDGVLPAGVQLPVGLADGPVLMLTAPTLRRGWYFGSQAFGERFGCCNDPPVLERVDQTSCRPFVHEPGNSNHPLPHRDHRSTPKFKATR